jgi:hypothetical protein
MPSSTDWTNYDLFFEPPISSCSRPEDLDDMFPSLDVYSFDPNDDVGTTIELHRVFVDRISVHTLSPKEVLEDYTFDSNTEGWFSGSAPGMFELPTAYHIPGALALQAVNNSNCFGFWTSPNDVLTSTGSELYQVTFSLVSNVTDRTQTPGFRLRLNTADFAWCVSQTIMSHGDGEMSPFTDSQNPGKRYEYNLYFYKPPTAEQLRLNVSLDMINFNPDDSPTGVLYLDRCRIQTLELPHFPEDDYF